MPSNGDVDHDVVAGDDALGVGHEVHQPDGGLHGTAAVRHCAAVVVLFVSTIPTVADKHAFVVDGADNFEPSPSLITCRSLMRARSCVT